MTPAALNGICRGSLHCLQASRLGHERVFMNLYQSSTPSTPLCLTLTQSLLSSRTPVCQYPDAKARGRSPDNPCGTYGGRSSTRTPFSPSTSVSPPCQYLSTNAPYSFIHHQRYINSAAESVVQ